MLHVLGNSEVTHTAPTSSVPPSTLVPSLPALAADYFGVAFCLISLYFSLSS